MKYLLEVGTEELPYKFIPQAIKQLKENFEKFFKENKVEFNEVRVLATPRRIAVIVEGLSEKQPDEEKIVKGPIARVAYDENGNLSKAGLGFLNKNNIDAKDAYVENDYLYAKVFVKGKDIKALLQENVAKLVLKVQAPHFMRWANFDEKFSRPLRWVVSIADNDELPVQIMDIKSSKVSRGHRFSKNVTVEINSVDEYESKLKSADVFVNQDERKNLIVELTKKEAQKLGADPYYTDDLLEEITYICEYPVPVTCEFDEKYLKIPDEVTVTVMIKHQRYFALYKNGKLLNKFITIANYLGNDFSNVKAGNERVIVARLDDAIFFFNEDTKKPFVDYVETLKGVTFQKGLGSMYDKTQRVVNLSEIIAGKLSINADDIKRTALLCKADLTTSLVCEFTELQGFIGADYAKLSGENEKVSVGIKEHYFPLNAESELAKNIEGQVVGIADKLDTVCAVFVGGKVPTGSSDPLGVRRAALGVIKTVISKDLNLNISELISKSLELIRTDKDVKSNVEEFFKQRLFVALADEYRKDVLEACAKNINPFENLCDYVKRVKLLSNKFNDNDFRAIVESSNRVDRILKETVQTVVDEALFSFDAEKMLYDSIKSIKFNNYEELYLKLVSANSNVQKFFEDVLVMDKDEKIKNNRLSMLTMLQAFYKKIADFSA